jgi:bifunctional non-homologous end joining protein LigD
MANKPSRVELPPGPALADLSPMLLAERKTPPAHEDAYLVEIKYDGYRVLSEFGAGKPTVLRTKNGANCTSWFPEVAKGLAGVTLSGRHVVDGEMCVLDDIGRADFDALQARALRRRFTAGDPPVTYCVFDLLVLDGRSVMGLPLLERKALLRQLLEPPPPFTLFADHFSGEGMVSWMFSKALELRLEGVVAKLANSAYQPGVRSPDWVKVKRPGAVPPGRFRRGA